jgi:DNA replication protein DnaD
VVAKWRQWRLWTLETALYDVQMDKQMKMIDDTFKSIDETTRCAIAFQTLADESKALALLLRYETSMRRMHEKALDTLMKLQAIRKSEESAPEQPTSTLLTKPQPQGSELTPEESTPTTPIEKLPNEPGAPVEEAA